MGVLGVFAYQNKPWEKYTKKFDEIAQTQPKSQSEPSKKAKKRKRKRGKKSFRDETNDIDVEIVELRARDRQIISKGPKFALPDKKLDFANGSSGRSLNQNEINRTLGSAQGKYIDCIKNARGSAELKAEIGLRLLVDENGRVEKKRVTAPRYLIDHGLFECMSRVANNMNFKATGAHSLVTVPFDLY